MNTSSRRNTYVAIALATSSFALFAVMSALAKQLGDGFSTIQVVFFRSVFAFVPLAFILYGASLGSALKLNRPGLMFGRIVAGLCAMACFFAGVTKLPLAEAVALAFAAPIFTTLLGRFWLGERVGIHRWSAVVVGLVGVIIIVRPGSALFTPWSLLPLGSAMFYSIGVILVRRLSASDGPTTIVLYFTVAATLITGVATPWVWVAPVGNEWLLFAAMGMTGGIMQLCSANALKRAEVAVLAPFEYTSLLWSALFGYLFWSEIPGLHMWAGAILIASSALYIVYRESKLTERGHA